MILMRGSILDGNVKKRGGGVDLLYFTYSLPTRSKEKEKLSLIRGYSYRESISMPKPVSRA